MTSPFTLTWVVRLLFAAGLLILGVAVARAETAQPPVVLKVYSDYV